MVLGCTLAVGRPLGRAVTMAGCALAATLAWAGAARAEITLTADEVARRVVASSPVLTARQADVEAAEAALTEARVAWLPRVAGAARYARLSPLTSPVLGNIVVTPRAGDISEENFPVSVAIRFPSLPNQTIFQAGVSLPLSDYLLRFPHTTTAAQEANAATRAQRQSALARVASDARTLYFEWARARLQRDVAVRAREQARAHLAQVSARRDAGGSTTADVLRVTSQLAAAEQLALRTTNLADLLEDQLRTALHDSGTEPYAVGDDLEATAAAPVEATDPERLYGNAVVQRGEVAAADHASAGELARARAARALMLPRLEVNGALLTANPNPRYFPQEDRFHTTWEVAASLTFSPNDLATGLAVARQHRARARAATAERASLAEAIRAQVLAAVRAQRESAALLSASGRGLAAAEESYRVRQALFAEGRATSVELTDAETDLLRARLAAVDARIDAALARVQLQRATGATLAGP